MEREDRRRLVKMLVELGRNLDSIMKTCNATREEILGDLKALGIDPDSLKGSSTQQPDPPDDIKNEQAEFTAIMMNSGIDSSEFNDKTIYSEGAKILCITRIAWPGPDGLEFVHKSDMTDHLLEKAIEDINKGGYSLRQGIMAVDAVNVSIDPQRGTMNHSQMHIITVSLQPKWAIERGTEPFTEAEKTAAVSLLTGVKNNDKSALKYVYSIPINTPQCVDFTTLTVKQEHGDHED